MSEEKVISRGKRKEFIGMVISDKMKKTIVVEVNQSVRHATYGKTMRLRVRFKAHDEKNEAHVGDRVKIVETRPMSKDKRWRLSGIVEKAKIRETGDDL